MIDKTDIRKLFIIHVDDHRLFLDGMGTAILGRYPNTNIEEFPTNDKALHRLSVLLMANKRPDLIITDFNHPGPNGLEFAQDAKALCKKHGAKIPIIMVTM